MEWNKVRGVLLDVDGVITQSMDEHIVSWMRAFDTVDIKIEPKEIAQVEGANYERTIDEVSKNHNSFFSEKQRKILHKKKEDYFKDLFSLKLYEEVPELFALLKEKNLEIVLVTGASRKVPELIFETDKNIRDAVKDVITGQDTQNGKPSSEPYLQGLKKLGLEKEEVFVIENAPYGIESAKSANIFTLALETTLSKEDLGKADLIFENHQKLIEFLKEKLS